MQTFLPYNSFVNSAKVLDYRRLGKQRVEARQILNVIINNKKSWRNHPAVNMWRGYTDALIEYGDSMIEEWINRGYRNTMTIFYIQASFYPPWLGDHDFHLSHRSNLVRKYPEYYSKIWPKVANDLPYIWPIGGK